MAKFTRLSAHEQKRPPGGFPSTRAASRHSEALMDSSVGWMPLLCRSDLLRNGLLDAPALKVTLMWRMPSQ